MSTLSDLLGIEHFTTSRGGTVRKDFITAVARSLGASDADFFRGSESGRPGTSKNKDEVLALAWELARKEPFPTEQLVEGMTITNDHIEAIVEGVMEFGLGPALDPEQTTGFHDLEDERRRRVAKQTVREGQSRFRNAVLDAYGNKCAITKTNLPVALQAAHIAPYKGRDSNRVSNGLCLRSDIHAMFDRHMLAIHEDSFAVLLSPAVRATTYHQLEGAKLHVPSRECNHPDRRALAHHREKSGLD
ncbi:hypothetical protein BJF89_10300 [Corynebacterium sp. CNJ-954]|nr:hypothetical protein BJF89_10300 [Corynebacterium sp. CNJ-954]